MIDDIALSADIQNELMDVGPDIRVCVDNKIAYIETEAAGYYEEGYVAQIRKVVETFKEISDVKIECHPIVPLSE